MTNRRQFLVRLTVGSIATGAFLWLFLRIAHLGDAWNEIRRLPWWSVSAALGFVLLNSAAIALRWRYLFAAARYKTTAKRLFPIYCVGAAANNILPARGGDLLRIEAVRENYRIPPFVTAGTLFAERLLDGIVLSIWILMGAIWIEETGILLLAGIGLSAGCTLGIVVVALAARRPERAEEVVWKLTRRLPSRWHSRIGRVDRELRRRPRCVPRAEASRPRALDVRGHLARGLRDVLGHRERLRARSQRRRVLRARRRRKPRPRRSGDRGRARQLRLPDARQREATRRTDRDRRSVRATVHAMVVLP